MKPIEENKNSLPDNAFRELKEGEEYVPLMKPEEKHREVTAWSVTWGIIMAIVFSAATAYLGLKVGQVFEAAIPITIIAVGLSSATHRKNPLGENVIIQKHWGLFWHDCSRCHIHFACSLHSAIHSRT